MNQLWEQLNQAQERQLTYTNRMTLWVNRFSGTARLASEAFQEIAPFIPSTQKGDKFSEYLHQMQEQMEQVSEAVTDFAKTEVEKSLILGQIAHASRTSNHE